MAEIRADHPCRPTELRELHRDGICEFYMTRSAALPEEIDSSVAAVRRSLGAATIAAECFGSRASDPLYNGYSGPLTWILGNSVTAGLGGLHLRGIRGAELEPVVLDGRTVGTVVHGPHASECFLAGIRAEDTAASRKQQAEDTFRAIERALETVEMDFSHVARTWLFLDDILEWYSEFNAVRTAFFTERGVFDRLVPASTGIGGANPWGAAMMVGAYAILPHDARVTVRALPSPMQCPALQYGSSFSRAVEVDLPGVRRVFVSGTASIDPDGRTAHVGDVRAQTALTCDVIAAILHSRGMGWEDVVRATAYVRHPEDAGVLEQHRCAEGLPELPVIVAHNTICRDDLLFELEVDAVQTQTAPAISRLP